MKLDRALRLDKAVDEGFNKHRTADGNTGVLIISVPLSKIDANTLGIGFLVNQKFAVHKMDEEIEEVSVELSPSGDQAPYDFIPELIGKPIIERYEDGLLAKLRVHVKDGHVMIVDGFFGRPNPTPFSLVVRPLQGALEFEDATVAKEEVTVPVRAPAAQQVSITGFAPIFFASKRLTAKIVIRDDPSGFVAASSASFNLRHAWSLGEEDSPVFAAESEAVEFAAARIANLAAVASESVDKGSRIELNELVEWCAKFRSKESLTAAESVVQ